ncbi:hypothetical protein HY500_01025 [Candidatus Woesearchaeota archaeon]|nr:hypothetical protein [Candidatus Woesearchaeota archaeon]
MHIIKRHRKKERFDERKLYASIYSAALTASYGEQKAEKLANDICYIIKKEVMKKTTTSDFIRKQVVKLLKKKDKDVAFLYETHLDLS